MPPMQAQPRGLHAPEPGAQTLRTWWSSLQWWPSVIGIGVAALVALGISTGSAAASTLAASGLVYLGAAALQKRSAAWPLFLLTFLVITAAKVPPRVGLVSIDATWVLIGLAFLFVVYGLMRGVTHPAGGLPLQAIAMVVCGLAAAIALIVSGNLGAYLVAAGLLGHAAWDVYHHWANKVVVRSMAEFCFVLDTLLALAIVVATVRS